MKISKSFLTALCLFTVVLLCSLALPPGEGGYKNLKVLPKSTTHEEMDSIMKSFNTALGVKCGFCHAAMKDEPRKLDFASDENKHKNIARSMMKMTARINRKYFKEHETISVSCYSCHNGFKEPKIRPEAKASEDDDD